MSVGASRVTAGVLGLSAVVAGGWAAAAPRSFFSSFPLPGHHWVSPLGPYDEHLTRDVGGLYLTLSVVSAWAAIEPRRETFAVVGSAWLVFGVPHLVYHVRHVDMPSTADAVGSVVALGGTVVLAALLLLQGRHKETAP